VVLMTIGLAVSTSAANAAKASGATAAATPTTAAATAAAAGDATPPTTAAAGAGVVLGALALLASLVANALLGVVQEKAFRAFGKECTSEMLFLSTAAFLPFYLGLNREQVAVKAQAWFSLPAASFVSSFVSSSSAAAAPDPTRAAAAAVTAAKAAAAAADGSASRHPLLVVLAPLLANLVANHAVRHAMIQLTASPLGSLCAM